MPSIPDLIQMRERAIAANDVESANTITDHIMALHEEQQASTKPESQQYQMPTAGARFDAPGAQYQPPVETLQRGAITAVRYAPAVAAGIMTGGAGFVPAALATGAIAGLSEQAAQSLEQMAGFRKETSPREVAAQTVMGAAVPVSVGGPVTNFLANALIGTTASEVSRAIEAGAAAPGKEEQLMRFEAPKTPAEAALRLLPAAAAGVGAATEAVASRAQNAALKREALQQERFGGAVALSEVLPDYTNIEAKAFQSGNEFARQAASNMDTNLGSVINEAWKDAPRADEIRKQMMNYAAPVEEMRLSAVAAKENAEALANRVKTERVANTGQQAQFAKEAQEAAVDAMKKQAIYMDGIDRLFPAGLGDIGAYSPGARIDFIQNASKAAKEAISSGMWEAFNNVGIGINEGIATIKSIENKVKSRITSNVDRIEIINAINKASETPGMLTKEGDLSFAGYRRIRDDIASGLTAAGKDSRYANKVAGDAYDAIRSAAQTYLRKKDYTKFKQFRSANEVTSAVYDARASATGVIDDLAEGKIDQVVAKIEKEGFGPVIKDINSYAEAIKGFGDETSRMAANRFKGDVALAIRDHLVESSFMHGKGMDASSQILDVPSLVNRIDALRTKGLSPEALGFGNVKDVQALARIADTKGGTMTTQQLNNFINDVGEVGRIGAIARNNYTQAYADYLSTTKSLEKSQALKRMNAEASKAKADAAFQERAYREAISDPLVQILNDKNLNLSPKLGDNAKYVDRVLASGPDGVKNLVTALETTTVSVADNIRKTKLLSDLKASATASMFMDKFQEALGPGDHRLKLEQITDFFFGASQKPKRDAFISLVGQEAFDTLKNTYAAPISTILATKNRLGVPVTSIIADIRPALGAIGAAQGKTTRGVIAGNQVVDSLNFFQRKMYNTAYLLYLDPVTSKAFQKASYNIDAFVNSNPRNAMLYQIAVNRDSQ